jgi:hypothetical protein
VLRKPKMPEFILKKPFKGDFFLKKIFLLLNKNRRAKKVIPQGPQNLGERTSAL